MRPKTIPKIRLFTPVNLQAAATVELSKEQAHYLVNVMRRKDADFVLLFNGKDGEWLAQILSSGKKHCTLHLLEQTRPQVSQPDIWLCFAPIKNAPIANMVQKSTELGVSCICPVITQHTIVQKVNIERLVANATEAAEQSERLTVPEIVNPVTLEKLLSNWDESRKIIFCDEAGGGENMMKTLARLKKDTKYAVLIGPEGGFSQSEFAILRNKHYIIPVGMGPRILRADTAAIVALASVFSILGDWDEKPAFRQ
jgi:16S rRNA (uracil1498-N3)-methyltransferase